MSLSQASVTVLGETCKKGLTVSSAPAESSAHAQDVHSITHMRSACLGTSSPAQHNLQRTVETAIICLADFAVQLLCEAFSVQLLRSVAV